MAIRGFGKNSGPTAPPSGETPFGHFPRPHPPSPPPPSTPPFPNSSAPLRSPSPRLFNGSERARSPSSFDNTRLAAAPPQPFIPPSGASSLEWGGKQSSFRGDFGSKIQMRSSPSGQLELGIGISSNSSRFQELERTRSPPVQYDDDFLNDSNSDVMEGNADVSSKVHGRVAPWRRQSPSSAVASNHSTINSAPSFSKPQRTALFSHTLGVPARSGSRNSGLLNERSISPTKTGDTSQQKENQRSSYPAQDASRRPSSSPPQSRSGTEVLGTSDVQYNQRSYQSTKGMNDDSYVTKLVSHPAPKRTRSPPSAAGLVIQIDSYSTGDGTERELQAKARRLERFKAELDNVEPNESSQYGPNVTKKRISVLKSGQSAMEKQKLSGNLPSRAMEDLPQDVDNEDSNSCSVIMGLCPDMCPESERAERERKGDLDHYERLDGDRNQTSKALAVKKYNRTAEREAELIRPMPILQKTMDYLLGLLDQPYDDRFLGLYNFLWDRMRAIRMDLRMQHIFDLGAINMLEQMIRLHILAMHELCEFPKGEGFSEGFDAHLNIEQMNKTSVELFQMYDDHRKRGVFIPTEKEFRGYYALLKLDKHPGYNVEPAELSLDLAKMTAEIRQTQEVLFARDVARSCRTGNFIAFFRHARKASYLQACLMHAHFSKLRTQALASLHSGLQYNQGIPMAHIAKWLGMEGEDIESLLEYHGFSIKEFEAPYMVKEGPFLNDDKDYSTRCSRLVHSKKSSTIVEDVLSSHQVTLSPSKSEKELHLVKDNINKPSVFQPMEAESPLIVSDRGVMDIEAVPSPRHSMQVQPFLGKSRGMQVQPAGETSNCGQLSMDDHHRNSAESPKKMPKTVASFSSHGGQEQTSSVASEGGSLIMDDGQLSNKTPPYNFTVPQFVPSAQPSFFGWARETTSSGPVRSSPETIVPFELKERKSDGVSANVREWRPPASTVESDFARSSEDDVCMLEVTRKECTDVREKVQNDDVASTYDQEVAEAKLKLLLRLWRRRSVRKRQFREQNQLAANAALSSLSLGPPVRQNKVKPMPSQKLNIDQAVNERYKRREQSWARWNVSELLASKLSEKNAISNCICWKLISFSWLHRGKCDREESLPVTHLSLDQWLHYKLIPTRKDETLEDLAMSAPGLSIWRKWIPNHSGGISCCLSVIKDMESGNFEKKLVGASAILFPISETDPWEFQRVQLHNLVMSLPPGAGIPLLIISGSGEDHSAETSCRIVSKLGLQDIDKSRVGNYRVVCLNEREGTGQLDGYFSDQKLKEGLMWLASESHPQPVLYRVTIRELVSFHLNLCLDSFKLIQSDKLGPNQCISAFNEALDRSISDIVSAANMNPTGWPCHELFLLDDSTAEFRIVKQNLPNLGWSSSEEIEPLISALRNCKLPPLSDDISQLTLGYSIGEEREDQRQLLQDCLIRYLTQSSNLMNWTMATKEASVMLQKCTKLELHNTEYKLIPNWLLIFRRVFNWQLNSSSSLTRKAYVSEQSCPNFSSAFLEKSEFEFSPPHHIAHPSLDEMVEVSCSPIVSKRVRSSPKSFHQKVAEVGDIRVSMFSDSVEKKNQCSQIAVQSVNDSEVHLENNDFQLVHTAEKPADKLTQLLDQCDMLQNEIEKKLSIYF